MKSVKVKGLKVGFILARDVEDAAGYKLLKEGTVLSDAHVALLRSWKIPEVWVEESARARPEAQAPKADHAADEDKKKGEDALLEQERARLMRRFEGRLTNPWMKALYAEAEKRLLVPRFWRQARP
jgi:hypothetical protein